jgi:hypothetical protein
MLSGCDVGWLGIKAEHPAIRDIVYWYRHLSFGAMRKYREMLLSVAGVA